MSFVAERRSVGGRVRRIGLGSFGLSIAVSAALGIYAVLAPDFGDTEAKILTTSLCVTGTVVLALGCEPAWERRRLDLVPSLGAGLGAVGSTLAIAGIWTEPESETWGRVMGTVFTLALACVLASLLALARLAPRHWWIFTATLALLGLGAAMVCILWWMRDEPADAYLRVLGVVMIALGAFIVTVPVLHWVDRATLAAAETSATRFDSAPSADETSTAHSGSTFDARGVGGASRSRARGHRDGGVLRLTATGCS